MIFVEVKNEIIKYVLLIILAGCVAQFKSGGELGGIVGEVRWIEGNLMPTPGETNFVTKAKGFPIQREVYIYEAMTTSETIIEEGTFFKPLDAKPVKKGSSDYAGHFRISLPSGRYSVFVLEQGRLYANIFDGDNFINPVTVEPAKFTEIKISINYQAYY